MARAVKYNLQQRLGLMERALEDNLLDQQRYDMLPKLAARAGWRGRDNTLASSSESIRTGSQSLEPSTSQDRSTHSADLQLSWNVLDFGIGYFGAKAQANKVLAAEERAAG
nr:TolC family protein [Pseudomonas brassicae]